MPVDDQLAILGRLALAAALGGLIGLEREFVQQRTGEREFGGR